MYARLADGPSVDDVVATTAGPLLLRTWANVGLAVVGVVAVRPALAMLVSIWDFSWAPTNARLADLSAGAIEYAADADYGAARSVAFNSFHAPSPSGWGLLPTPANAGLGSVVVDAHDAGHVLVTRNWGRRLGGVLVVLVNGSVPFTAWADHVSQVGAGHLVETARRAVTGTYNWRGGGCLSRSTCNWQKCRCLARRWQTQAVWTPAVLTRGLRANCLMEGTCWDEGMGTRTMWQEWHCHACWAGCKYGWGWWWWW